MYKPKAHWVFAICASRFWKEEFEDFRITKSVSSFKLAYKLFIKLIIFSLYFFLFLFFSYMLYPEIVLLQTALLCSFPISS